MQIVNIDELRTISSLSVDVSEKIKEADLILKGVVSKHSWKCSERVAIDEHIEYIKENSNILSEACVGLSSKITDIANDYTDYINDQYRSDSRYMDDVASTLALISSGGITTSVLSGNNIGSLVSSIGNQSFDTANISSLNGSTHGISIIDFSLFME